MILGAYSKTGGPSDCHPRANRAFTLLECLVYVGLLAVLLSMAFVAFYTVGDYSKHLSRNAADISRALKGGERWRNDVRSSVDQPELLEADGQTILRLPQAAGEVEYAYRGGVVYRRSTTNAWRVFLAGVKISRMEQRKLSHVWAWRWEMELQTTQKVARVKPLFTFQAVVTKPSL